jgi:hypothetical protein
MAARETTKSPGLTALPVLTAPPDVDGPWSRGVAYVAGVREVTPAEASTKMPGRCSRITTSEGTHLHCTIPPDEVLAAVASARDGSDDELDEPPLSASLLAVAKAAMWAHQLRRRLDLFEEAGEADEGSKALRDQSAAADGELCRLAEEIIDGEEG